MSAVSKYSLNHVRMDIFPKSICPRLLNRSSCHARRGSRPHLLLHDHTPVTFNLARLPRHQVSPDRPRHRAHSIFFNRDLNILPLIPNLIHRTDNRSGALKFESNVSELSDKRQEKKRERNSHPCQTFLRGDQTVLHRRPPS